MSHKSNGYSYYLNKITDCYRQVDLIIAHISILNFLNKEESTGYRSAYYPTPEEIRIDDPETNTVELIEEYSPRIKARTSRIEKYDKKKTHLIMDIYGLYHHVSSLYDKGKINEEQYATLLNINFKNIEDEKVQVTAGSNPTVKLASDKKSPKKSSPTTEFRFGDMKYDGFFQRQDTGLSCGRNALNNMFGLNLFVRWNANRQDGQLSLESIWRQPSFTQCPNENYTDEVLIAAVLQFGYIVTKQYVSYPNDDSRDLLYPKLSHSQLPEPVGSISDELREYVESEFFQGRDISSIKVLILINNNHWVSISIQGDGSALYHNSFNLQPIRYDRIEDITHYLLSQGNVITQVICFYPGQQPIANIADLVPEDWFMGRLADAMKSPMQPDRPRGNKVAPVHIESPIEDIADLVPIKKGFMGRLYDAIGSSKTSKKVYPTNRGGKTRRINRKRTRM